MIELLVFLKANEDYVYAEAYKKAKDLIVSFDHLGQRHTDMFKKQLIDVVGDFVINNCGGYSKEYLLTELTEDVIIKTLGTEFLDVNFWRKK